MGSIGVDGIDGVWIGRISYDIFIVELEVYGYIYRRVSITLRDSLIGIFPWKIFLPNLYLLLDIGTVKCILTIQLSFQRQIPNISLTIAISFRSHRKISRRIFTTTSITTSNLFGTFLPIFNFIQRFSLHLPILHILLL